MVSSIPLIEVISEKLKFYKAKNIVADPVMVSTSGSILLKDDAIESLKKLLFPQAVLLTPNIPEASALAGIAVVNDEDMIKAAEIISNEFGCLFFVKADTALMM